jgi:hypothetical protein
MYALNPVDSFHISEPKGTYVYDIAPVAAGLAAISSDDSLRLLDLLALSEAPINSIRRVNTDVTCLKAINNTAEGDALLVGTAGRDGRVCLLDPRTGAKIGEVQSGESSRHELCTSKLVRYLYIFHSILRVPTFLIPNSLSSRHLWRRKDHNFSYTGLVVGIQDWNTG